MELLSMSDGWNFIEGLSIWIFRIFIGLLPNVTDSSTFIEPINVYIRSDHVLPTPSKFHNYESRNIEWNEML